MADLVQPTKPATGYWLWLSENRPALTKELGKTQGAAVAKFAGERWKALPAAAKKPFEEKAAKAKEEYDLKMKEFLEAGGVKNKRKMKEPKDGKQSKKARAEAREASGKPKRAPSSYFIYVKENQEAIKKEVGPGKTAAAVGALAGKKWKAMTAAEKKPYDDKAAALKAEYTKAMEEWKKNGGANAEAEDDEDDNEEEQ